MTTERIRAAAYLRVSSKGQAQDDRDGFPRQQAAVEAYAQAKGMLLAGEWRDAATGTDWEHREGLADLLAACERDGIAIVLVERADRLARDLMVSEVLLAEFRRLGVQVLAADSGIDLTVADGDPTRVLIRQVLGAVAQFEKSALVAKLRLARERRRRETGRCEGRHAFGTQPGESDTLARMRQLHRKPRGGDRLSYRRIAAVLNAEGLRTRQGGPWHGATVRAIVLNTRWPI